MWEVCLFYRCISCTSEPRLLGYKLGDVYAVLHDMTRGESGATALKLLPGNSVRDRVE